MKPSSRTSLGALAGEQHELPAVPPGPHQDAGGRARGVADLQVHLGEPGAGARNGVDDEPGLVELEIDEPAPDRLAHRARGAVAADDVARVHAERAVRPRDLDGHPAGLGAEPLEGSAEEDAGMRRALQLGAQRALQAGLVEHVAGGPAGRGERPRHVLEADEDLAVGAPELVARGRPRVPLHLVRDPELLEDAHDLGVEVRGAGERIDLRRLVDGEDLDARVGEERGQRGAHGSQPDDQDLAGAQLGHPATSATQRFSIAPRPSISTRTTSPGAGTSAGSSPPRCRRGFR